MIAEALNKIANLEFIQQTYGNVTLVNASLPNSSDEAGKFVWKLEVPANGSVILTYTSRVARN